MFAPGKKVICITRGVWYDKNFKITTGPEENEILIIDEVNADGGLIFYKYDKNEGYEPNSFRLIDDIADVAEKIMQEFAKEEQKTILKPEFV